MRPLEQKNAECRTSWASAGYSKTMSTAPTNFVQQQKTLQVNSKAPTDPLTHLRISCSGRCVLVCATCPQRNMAEPVHAWTVKSTQTQPHAIKKDSMKRKRLREEGGGRHGKKQKSSVACPLVAVPHSGTRSTHRPTHLQSAYSSVSTQKRESKRGRFLSANLWPTGPRTA